MQCKNPYYEPKYGILCPCRQCLPCRVNRRQDWATRAILEASDYKHITFLTLTYNDENLPLNCSLEPKKLQLFWKLLRKDGLKFRYFACGEYGEQSYRPHYHAIIYGQDALTVRAISEKHWKNGFVYSVPATIDAIKYVAGYVTKKLAVNKELRDCGLVPEFIRTSKGIGSRAIEKLKDKALLQNDALDTLNYIMIGGKKCRVPAYIKKKLREIVFDDEYIEKLKSARIYEMQDEVVNNIEKHFNIKDNVKDLAIRAHKLEYKQQHLNLISKDRLWNFRSKI